MNERNFCEHCGKRLGGEGHIHTCTPPAAQPAVPLTERDLASACLSYRHDFGLMDEANRGLLMFQAREWARAFGLSITAAPPAAQPAPVPLTDEQIQLVVSQAVSAETLSWLGYKKDADGKYTVPVLSPSDYQFARAIEAAHGITAAPIVATPRAAQKPWVGLTDEEREQHRDDWRSNIHDKEFRAIEAKLKEKNGL